MLKGGVISKLFRLFFRPRLLFFESSFLTFQLPPFRSVDVVNVEQAIIAEKAGACAVMVRSL